MDFERIYRSYFQDVYRFLCGLSADKHIAEEVTQESFFKALKAILRFTIQLHQRKTEALTHFRFLLLCMEFPPGPAGTVSGPARRSSPPDCHRPQ